MMLPMTESVLAPGVILRAVQTKKFKTSMLSVTFLEPLTADHASLNALLPKVLRRGTQRHPDISTAGESSPFSAKREKCSASAFGGVF